MSYKGKFHKKWKIKITIMYNMDAFFKDNDII